MTNGRASTGHRLLTDPALFWEMSGDLFSAADSEGRFVDVNPAWHRVLGWERDQLLGRLVTDFMHPSDLETATGAAEAVVDNSGRVGGVETRLRCADGSHRWIRWSAYTDGDGWCGVGQDITERRDAESARDLARRKAAEAYETTGLSAWIWDPVSDYVALSGELEGVREALGIPSTFEGLIQQIQPSHRTELWGAVQRLVEGVADNYCVRFPATAEHGVRWLESRGVAVRDANGEIEAVHGTTQDVTEAELARLELLRARDFYQRTLDSLDAHVAVLDEQGTIEFVNGAWDRFAAQNGASGLGVGQRYLDVCDADRDASSAAAPGRTGLAADAGGLAQLVRGRVPVPLT